MTAPVVNSAMSVATPFVTLERLRPIIDVRMSAWTAKSRLGYCDLNLLISMTARIILLSIFLSLSPMRCQSAVSKHQVFVAKHRHCRLLFLFPSKSLGDVTEFIAAIQALHRLLGN